MSLTPDPHDARDRLVERSAALEMLATMADRTARSALAPRSREAYAADWAAFCGWCESYGLVPLPATADTVRLWLTDLSLQVTGDGGFRYSPASMERFLSSIARMHRDAGHPTPTRDARVATVMSGIRRERGTRQRRARPLLTEDLVRVVAAMDLDRWPAGVSSTRDALALWLGFTTALRRSSVAALDVGDLTLEPDGMHVRLARSKTDQEGRGAVLGVPYGSSPATCVPCMTVRWLRLTAAPGRVERMREVLGRDGGEHACRGGLPSGADPARPLMLRVDKSGRVLGERLTPQGLNDMLKRRLVKAGYDPRPFSFHSLRAGFVTQARGNGADARAVRLQTGHSSDAMVDVYDREHRPLADGNAVWRLGL